MKKITWLILIVGFGFCIYLVSKPTPKQIDVPKEIASLPAFNLLLTDSQTVINTSKGKNGKATLLFYFEPNCAHCQNETEDLLTNKNILEKTNIYFISLDPMERIRKFMKYYNLRELPGITVAKDYQFSAINIFKLNMIPSNIVYNNKNEIVKIFEGGISVHDLDIALNIR